MDKLYGKISIIIIIFFFLSMNSKDNSNILVIKASDKKKIFDNIYIEKGNSIEFAVKGKWSMWYPQWAGVDSTGHKYFKKIHGFHIGTLLGQVEGGEPFVIYNGLRYKSPNFPIESNVNIRNSGSAVSVDSRRPL